MIVRYKGQEFKDVRAMGFNMSNELGVCVYLVQEVENKEYPEQNSKCTTLECVEIGKLKVVDDGAQG